jgi:hypothetical protein
MRLGQEPKRNAMEAESNPKSGLLRSGKGGNTDMELLDPKTSAGKELGYLALRLATIDAEQTSDRAALRRSLERRIDVIVKRATRQDEPQDVEHQRKTESKPIPLAQAKARTELLMSSL